MRPSWRMLLTRVTLRFRDRRYMARVVEPADVRVRTDRRLMRLFPLPENMYHQWGTLRAGEDRVEALWISGRKVARRSILLYLHGGAYVMGSPLTHRHLAGRLSQLTGMRAVMPRYGLAPEHPHPEALADVLTAYRALLEAGYDPRHIGLAGDSAGGGLALGLLHRLGELGLPRPACATVFSPWTDLSLQSPSIRENAGTDVMLPGERIEEIRDMVLGGRDPLNPCVSPVFGDFSGAGPFYVQASSSEILRDDAIRFAARAAGQGCAVTRDIWENVPHALPLMERRVPEAGEVIYRAADFLKAHVRGTFGPDRMERRRRTRFIRGGEAGPPE
ncbi:alpha/beta hydrolase fold domain-containing protein [Algicella marina]|uniref:Alpha/beta hydrolase fold domain-containing protein n=1 Tax=Algicella marina TaxID=2683284 RepID=A0A6P1T2N0_9RHOB|nr:alpha/beta hydrolase fold domain-containing protein [Algicella marina]QHQ35923.1 alpha/beta hydrolase fold domain-containing protein [Algicella marina]